MKKILLFALFTLSNFAFSGARPKVPTEIIVSRPPVYISPKVSNANKNKLYIKDVKIQIQDKAVIKRYSLVIYNKIGQKIWEKEEENMEERGMVEFFEGADRPSVKIPDTLVWNGKGSDGKQVPDGEYFYQFTVWDSFKIKTVSAPLLVVVDTVSPNIISLKPNTRVFSPNNDKKKDTIKFNQTTGEAYTWTYEIIAPNGQTVWSKISKAQGDTELTDIPSENSVVWNGYGNDKKLQKEGNYTYKLTGEDRAGNIAKKEFRIKLSNNDVDTEITFVKGNNRFSSASKKSVKMNPLVADPNEIKDWTFEIKDGNNVIKKLSGGVNDLPKILEFDGHDSNGKMLPDGKYKVSLTANYKDGTTGVSDSRDIIVKNTPPFAKISADTTPLKTDNYDTPIFGGKEKPGLSIDMDYTKEDTSWFVHIKNLENKISYDMPLKKLLILSSFPNAWNGEISKNKKIESGKYSIFIEGVDSFGNKGSSNEVKFIFDNRQRNGKLSVDPNMLAPGDGKGHNRINMNPYISVNDYIESYKYKIVGTKGNVAFEKEFFDDDVKPSYWDGRNKEGKMAQSGKYDAILEVKYLNGDTKDFYGDSKISFNPPKALIRAYPPTFSPDGDGEDDTTEIEIDTTSSTENIKKWRVEILDPKNHLFYKKEGKGAPPKSIVWDGHSTDGKELVESASTYKINFYTDSSKKPDSGNVNTDILVMKNSKGQLQIRINSINFTADKSDLFQVGAKKLQQNLETLRRLAIILKKYKNYDILIQGHATYTTYGNKKKMAIEQKNELVPLSADRALEVKEALAILGIEWGRMKSKGIGGLDPIIGYDNPENLWKNRRVEFILQNK